MKYDFWGRLKMLKNRNLCRSNCLFCEYYEMCRMNQLPHNEPEPETEQRCGTCTERFACPAWPGVAYPCPHYNDQDGIMKERRRKEAEEEAAFWAIQEELREELMYDGEED